MLSSKLLKKKKKTSTKKTANVKKPTNKNMVNRTLQKYMVYMKRIGMALAKGTPIFQNSLRCLKESINTGVRVL